MKSYRAGEHYGISTNARGEIGSLFCMFCEGPQVYSVNPASFFKGGDKSGAPRYARARSAMVRHIAEVHPGKATEAPPDYEAGLSMLAPHPDAVRDGAGVLIPQAASPERETTSLVTENCA